MEPLARFEGFDAKHIWSSIYTDTIKKRPLYVYVKLLQTNAMFSFDY